MTARLRGSGATVAARDGETAEPLVGRQEVADRGLRIGNRGSGTRIGDAERGGVKAGRRGCPRGRGKTHLVLPGTRNGEARGQGQGLSRESGVRGQGRAPGARLVCPRGLGKTVRRSGVEG